MKTEFVRHVVGKVSPDLNLISGLRAGFENRDNLDAPENIPVGSTIKTDEYFCKNLERDEFLIFAKYQRRGER